MPSRTMGHQPALDGLRGVSVIAVILYHGGFAWMSGGFYGVEVFFVVSGFLITSLLLEERASTGRTDLGRFWLRRARRLLPALFTMVVAVALWAALFGTDEQQSQLKRDLPWSILYVGNWGQIFGAVAYYSPADPPLLRHLWSLAVEEQWYIVWPIVFAAISAARWKPATSAKVCGGLFLLGWLWMAWLTRDGLAEAVVFAGQQVDRTNFVYLSTITRAGGLLLGAAAAFVWRPWRQVSPQAARPLPLLEGAGGAAVAALLIAFSVAHLAEVATFRWVLPVVSIASCVAVCVVVHPGAPAMRALAGRPAIVAVGTRSYGLYLWHWPILVFLDARSGSVGRFTIAMVLSVAVSEACYRYVETPVRRGWIGAHVRMWRANGYRDLPAMRQRITVLSAGGAVLVLGLTAFYAQVDTFDRAEGGQDAEFVLSTTPPPAAVGTTAPVTVAADALPVRLVVVGDSQAHALVTNRPSGIGSTFTVTDGSVDGCGVLDSGRLLTTRTDVKERTFEGCVGWEKKWAKSATAADAQIALVVLGAWDVFDIAEPAGVTQFGSDAWDQRFLGNLQQGIDTLAATGARVALLEVACMRPIDVDGAAVPALPERGRDDRVAHVTELLRQAAAANPDTTTFVAGPTEWCNDPAISEDLGYRWDGVHVYKPGADLIFETIAPAVLAIPRT